MEELTGDIEKSIRQIDDIRASLDDRRMPGADAFAAKINGLTQQLMEISSKADLAETSPEVPEELLRFLDQGNDCNPYRFQFELFEEMERSGVIIADKVKRLKTLNDDVSKSVDQSV